MRLSGLGAESRPRIVDQCGEDVTQQIALRDNHVGAVLDHSRIKLALGHERRAELIEIAVEPPMTPRPDLMHRSVPVPTAIKAGGLSRTDVEIDVDRPPPPHDCPCPFPAHPPHPTLTP